MQRSELVAAYWKLHDCREIIRSTANALSSIDAVDEYAAAYNTVQAAMDRLPASTVDLGAERGDFAPSVFAISKSELIEKILLDAHATYFNGKKSMGAYQRMKYLGRLQGLRVALTLMGEKDAGDQVTGIWKDLCKIDSPMKEQRATHDLAFHVQEEIPQLEGGTGA